MRSRSTPDPGLTTGSSQQQQPAADGGGSGHSSTSSTTLSATAPMKRPRQLPLSPPPSFSETSLRIYEQQQHQQHQQQQERTNQTRRTHKTSMSPDPDLVFPTLTLSPRATPEREMDSRECSPELERSLSPEPAVNDWPTRSRSSSPEVVMRPEPTTRDSNMSQLREMSPQTVNARRPPRRTDSASSVMSFDMVNSYQSLAPADIMRAEHNKKKQQQKRTQSDTTSSPVRAMPPPQTFGTPFKPNAGLSKPITPSFIRDYDRDVQQQQQQQQTQQTQRPCKTLQRHNTEKDMSRAQSSSPSASSYFPHMSASAHQAPIDDRQMDMMIRYRHHGDTIASDPTASSQSGMASFFEQLDKDMQAKGWQYAVLPSGRLKHSYSSVSSSTHLSNSRHDVPSTADAPASNKSPKDSLSAVYYNEVSSQVDSVLRHFKTPLVSFGLVALVGFFLYGIFNTISSDLALVPTGTNSTAWGSVDFPTLMNIESAFERVVDSSAGGSELARSLKNSEMAVSDLSTVVRHSDLKCRETLSTRLERFADDARFNVLGLLNFASEVGGVLDQLLSVNQYALRELLSLSQQPPSPFLSHLSRFLPILPSPSRRAHRRLSEIFDTAVEVLESNLRVLIAEGSNIESALDALALQHKPIHEEIIREFSDLRKAEAEALSSLWNRFAGAGSGKRANFKENERLLSEIHTYQDKARGYVEVTLMELRRMTGELDHLRRRVAEPLLVGDMIKGSVSGKGGMWGGRGGGGGSGRGGMEGILEVHTEAVKSAVEALVRKRRGREERLRVWNKLILEREMGEGIDGGKGARV